MKYEEEEEEYEEVVEEEEKEEEEQEEELGRVCQRNPRIMVGREEDYDQNILSICMKHSRNQGTSTQKC